VDESGRFCSLPQMGGNQPEVGPKLALIFWEKLFKVLVSLCYFDVQNRLMVGVNKAAAIGTMGRKEEGHGWLTEICGLKFIAQYPFSEF
jgi:hypothetical protein